MIIAISKKLIFYSLVAWEVVFIDEFEKHKTRDKTAYDPT